MPTKGENWPGREPMSLIETSERFFPLTLHRIPKSERWQIGERGFASLSAHLDAMPAIAWWSSRDGRHMFFNQEWIAFTGAESLAQNIFNAYRSIHPADIAPLQRASAALFATESNQRVECRLLHASGYYHGFEAEVRAQPAAAARGEGFIVTCRPVGGCNDAAR